MRLFKKSIITLSLAFGVSVQAFATELMVWDKKPLQMEFETETERLIEFPDNVAVAVPPQLLNKVRVSSSGGVVYLTPLADFESTRFEFQMLDTGELVFADLRSSQNFSGLDSSETIKVVTAKTVKAEQAKDDAKHLSSSTVGLTDLLRAASRDWYAPVRLRNLEPGIKVKPVTGSYNLALFWTGKSAGLYKMTPLREYMTRDYTLTAILLESNSLRPVTIDLADVYPDVKAVSSQHMRLGPIGSESAATVLYVISEGQSFLKKGVYAL